MDCGKVFRNTAEASWHGDKSGHSNFEESTEEKKPLTEEEKKEKLKELQEKAAMRKAAAAVKDAEEQRKNEAIRRKGGQDLGKIKEELKLKEAEKEAKQRKQGQSTHIILQCYLVAATDRIRLFISYTPDKLDEAKARARVKAQIEQDKRERAEKAAREKALREGKEPATSVTSVGAVSNAASTATKSSTTAAGSDNPQTRLSIRLPYGQPIITTRESSEKLKDTVEWVRNNCNQQIFQGKVSIPFPRKQFSDAEMEKTLKELDLTPSSVILIN